MSVTVCRILKTESPEKVEGSVDKRWGGALNKDAGMEHSSCARVPLLSVGSGTTWSPDVAVAQLREAPSIYSFIITAAAAA